jgi:hypothetical protein
VKITVTISETREEEGKRQKTNTSIRKEKRGAKRGKEPFPYLKSKEERKPFLFQARRRSQSNINPDHKGTYNLKSTGRETVPF